jgi:hypothetical protein
VNDAQESKRRLEYVKIIVDIDMNHEVFSDGVDTCTSPVPKYGDWPIVADQKYNVVPYH